MSDFFHNLLSRSRPVPEGEGTLLRPRLPSLFEGPAGGAPLSAPARQETTGMDELGARTAAEARSPRPFPAAFDPQQEFISPFEPSRGLGTETEKSGRRRSRPEASFPSRPEEDARQASSPEPGSEAGRDQNDSSMNRSRYRFYSEEEDRYARREEAAGQFRARQSQVPAGREESLNRAAARGIDDQAEGSRAARGETAEGHVAHAETHVLRPVLESVRPAAEAPARDPRRNAFPSQGRALPGSVEFGEERPAAPVVRISIGRIEVRAVSPAPLPAARPAAAPRPKLSLDEYLRQRNEGKR